MADVMFFLLPALLVFAITFGALETADILKNRRINALIGIIIAAFSMTSEQVVSYIWQFLPWAAILFIVVFFFGFVKSIFKVKDKEKPDYILIAIIAMLGLLLVYTQPQLLTWLPSFGLGSGDVLLVIGLIIIAIIFYATYSISKK